MDSKRHKSLPNPRDRANFLSILTFWWTFDLFRLGYRKPLDVHDIFQPRIDDASTLLGDRLETKWKIQVGSAKPSLVKALFAAFWREFALLGTITTINQFGSGILQPILLGKFLLYFREGSDVTYQDAIYYATGLIVCTSIYVFSYNQFVITSFHSSMKVRIAICAVIYRKSLKLSRSSLGDTAPGKIVNLLSNDVNRFDNVIFFLHSMWAAPLVTLVACILLWKESGWTGMVGALVILLFVPVQSYTGKLSSKYRMKTALKTDERIRFMDEIISGVHVIKMYAWEKPFSKLIQLARRLELKIVIKSSYLRGLYMTLILLTTRLAIFCTIITIVLTDQQLTASKIFVTLAYYNIMTTQMTQMFVRGVAEIAEISVAIKRLRAFLVLDEKTQTISNKWKPNETNRNENDGRPYGDNSIPINPAISFKNANARWTLKDTQTPLTLENINIDFKRGSLIGIVGPVGAGKSSLLQTILQELPLESGTMSINGRLSYACQEPWIFAGTVKQNITFGLKMDKSRYDEITKSCALIADFKQFPHGDKSMIGERGSSLSGGQKARINLARALYREAEIYLFDDPLSAVDAHVGLHLFDNVIGPKSRLAKVKSTRILVTHQVHYLKNADSIVVIKDGKIQFQGTPRELVRSGIDIAELVNINETDNSETDQSDKISLRRNSSHKSISSYDREMLFNLDRSNSLESLDEENLEKSSKGAIKGSVLSNYFRSGANPFSLVGLLILFIFTQVLASFTDWWMSFFTAQEEKQYYFGLLRNSTDSDATDGNATTENIFYNEISTNACMYVHGSLVIGLFTVAILRAATFYSICVRASQVLHDGMFRGIIYTVMRFFDLNPSGRILNRFSNDMGLIDEFLPKALLDSIQIFLMIFGSIIITIIINPLFCIPICVLALLSYFIRKVYLRTSTNLKRIEGITRSPVFSHLAASLSGLATIRASDAQSILTQEFHVHQDLHSGSLFMFLNASMAFGFWLDLVCLVFITIVTYSFLVLDTTALGGKVGLAITQSLTMPSFMQWAARQSAEVTNFMMSVERLLEYRDLPEEKQPPKPLRPAANEWPTEGKLIFKNVSFRYFEDAELVLNDLNFVIAPREKIGIVGRTGAGKSSLIGAIFRLALVEGEIFIDGIATSAVTLQQLRTSISIIPQDPVLFSGTLRLNLDPFDIYTDAEIWDALEQVELKEMAKVFGLDGVVLAGGNNYSVGQRQLICLARAILRKNKILVLDEATANVDPKTDVLIQHTIRQRFTDCTILTIAHRLHTIMDSDRVLVMNLGTTEEFAPPYELLLQPNSIFRQMVDATGPQESERLTKMAYESYFTKQF